MVWRKKLLQLKLMENKLADTENLFRTRLLSRMLYEWRINFQQKLLIQPILQRRDRKLQTRFV